MTSPNFSSVRFFDLSNIVYDADKTTVALFNSVRPIESDFRGKFIWTAYKPEGSGVWAKKEYLKKDKKK